VSKNKGVVIFRSVCYHLWIAESMWHLPSFSIHYLVCNSLICVTMLCP
jgi:hypothetical protein